MNSINLVATVALLLQLGCKEDQLDDALYYLSGMPVPDTARTILADARMAIQWAVNNNE